VYAATKLAQENILRAWSSSFGSALTVLRLQNVYGPGQSVSNPYSGVLTFFARELSQGRSIEVFEEGGIVRDFVHVSDVVSSIVSALGGPRHPGELRTFDIGSGAHGTLAEYAAILAGFFDQTVRTSKRYRLGDVRAAYADNTFASRDLGFEPAVNFESGVRGLIDWVFHGFRESTYSNVP
jgi:dTDP-L-rhamnose 4-epimerase